MTREINPVFILAALLLRASARPAPTQPLWRCRFCKAEIDHRTPAESPGCATHPANTCRYGKAGKTEHGPCAIPKAAVEPLGRNYFIGEGVL